MIAAIVLAAGASTRMGRPKLLLGVGAGTLLSTTASRLLEAGIDPVVIVLGCEAEAVRRGAALEQDGRVRFVVNDAWREGMASSLRRGLDACGDATGALVVLGDQPPSVALVVRIVAAWNGQPLLVPVLDSRAGHPVLFARTLWDELRAIRGDVGGRDVVRRHWTEAGFVAGEAAWDVDTEADYRALCEGRPPRAGEGLEVL